MRIARRQFRLKITPVFHSVSIEEFLRAERLIERSSKSDGLNWKRRVFCLNAEADAPSCTKARPNYAVPPQLES